MVVVVVEVMVGGCGLWVVETGGIVQVVMQMVRVGDDGW